MSEETRQAIIRYCDSHPDASYAEIATQFGISEREAQDIYMDWLMG